MIRPGNELLTDQHRAVVRWLPTTALGDKLGKFYCTVISSKYIDLYNAWGSGWLKRTRDYLGCRPPCHILKVVSILPPIFWQQQIGWSYCAASRTWHDAIRIKRSVCHAIGLLLIGVLHYMTTVIVAQSQTSNHSVFKQKCFIIENNGKTLSENNQEQIMGTFHFKNK